MIHKSLDSYGFDIGVNRITIFVHGDLCVPKYHIRHNKHTVCIAFYIYISIPSFENDGFSGSTIPDLAVWLCWKKALKIIRPWKLLKLLEEYHTWKVFEKSLEGHEQ